MGYVSPGFTVREGKSMNFKKRTAWIHLLLACFVLLGLATPALGQTIITQLVQGVPTGVSISPMAYAITIQQTDWNVVGICYHSMDWTLTHGGATSAQSGFVCEYVLADGNAGTISGNTGTATTSVSPMKGLICHAAHGALTPGTAASYSWQNDVIYFWEVRITTPGTFNINVAFQGLSTINNMKYAWFNPQNTSNWLDRSGAAFVNTAGTAQSNYSVTAAGTYCLVAYEDATIGLLSGTLTATVTPVTSGAIFQAASVSVPGAPVSVNPGGTFTANSQIRNTGTSAGSTSYTIYLSTDNVITTSDTQVFMGTTPSIASGGTHSSSDTCTVPGAQGAGNYYVGLYLAPSNTAVTTAQDVTVNSVGSVPGPFNLVSPASAATGVSTNPTYSWTAASGATTYTLEVATDAGMTNLVINKTGITGISDTPAQILTSGTQYYWRVTAVNTFGNTLATGAPWSFTTSSPTSLPGNFDLISPFNGATGVSTSPLYSWNASSGAVDYRLEVATDAAMTSLVVNHPGITATLDIPATPLTPSTMYYWRVTAQNSFGTTVSSGAPWSFTTSAFDPVASSITLLDAPVRVPHGSTFSVTRNIVNNGSAAGYGTYEIYLSLDPAIGPGDILVFYGATPSIAPSATNSQTLVLDVPSSAVEGKPYYVGLYIAAGNSTSSAGTLTVIQVEPESALGCGGGRGRGPAGLIPLALLAVLVLWARRRTRVIRNRSGRDLDSNRAFSGNC